MPDLPVLTAALHSSAVRASWRYAGLPAGLPAADSTGCVLRAVHATEQRPHRRALRRSRSQSMWSGKSSTTSASFTRTSCSSRR